MPQSPFLLKRHLVDFAGLLAEPIVSNSEFSGLFDALGLDLLSKHPKVAHGRIGVVVSASSDTMPSVLRSSPMFAQQCVTTTLSSSELTVRPWKRFVLDWCLRQVRYRIK